MELIPRKKSVFYANVFPPIPPHTANPHLRITKAKNEI
ncbi:hypothetical protein AXX16_3451 [Serratia rubidaea]|nr:hypothetical protein AXX16_3451 [Serratia rubidaea]